jgi:YHS domain-containing protein
MTVAGRDGMPQDSSVDSQQTLSQSTKNDVSVNRVATNYHDAVRPWKDKQLGLGGYCPVSLSQTMAWKAGGATFEHVVDGVCYRLSTTEQLDRFRQAPEKFFPALHGYDAVAMKDGDLKQSGAIELGARYRGRLFFFANAANRDRFLQNPNPYADLALGRPELLSTAVDTGRGL